MKKVCLKCGAENAAATGEPADACPSCGAIYSKVERMGITSTPAQGKSRRSIQVRIPLGYIVACALSLAIGYFVGREHVKYQIASNIRDAFSGIRIPEPPENHRAAAPEQVRPPKNVTIDASLVSKSFRDQDFSGSHMVKAAIVFSVKFTNRTDKQIRAFDGVLSFNDLLGNTISASKLTISEPIPAQGEFIWNGELGYNEFLSTHTELRSYEPKNLKVVLTPKKILFGDGTEQLAGC